MTEDSGRGHVQPQQPSYSCCDMAAHLLVEQRTAWTCVGFGLPWLGPGLALSAGILLPRFCP